MAPNQNTQPQDSGRSTRPAVTNRKAWEWRSAGFVVALRCQNAYSAMAYRSWPAVATALLKAGWTEQETETIMRSKITRWARDWSPKNYRHGEYPASVVLAYLAKYPDTENIKRWTREAFPEVA